MHRLQLAVREVRRQLRLPGGVVLLVFALELDAQRVAVLARNCHQLRDAPTASECSDGCSLLSAASITCTTATWPKPPTPTLSRVKQAAHLLHIVHLFACVHNHQRDGGEQLREELQRLRELPLRHLGETQMLAQHTATATSARYARITGVALNTNSRPWACHTANAKVADRNVKDFGWEMRSGGRFATPADSPRHDCSPYSHVHARRESLGFVHRSRAIFSRAVLNPNPLTYTIRNFFVK